MRGKVVGERTVLGVEAEADWSLLGQNSLGKTSAAAVPYRKTSYHSIAVPTVLASTARVTCLRGF
jgi:hypothetical protein